MMKLPEYAIHDCTCKEFKSKDVKDLGECIYFKILFPVEVHPRQVTEAARLKNLKLNVHVFARGRVEMRVFMASDIKYGDDNAEMWVGVELDDLIQVYNLAPHVIYKSRLEIEFDCVEKVKWFQGGLFDHLVDSLMDTLSGPEWKKEEERSNSFEQPLTTVLYLESRLEVLEQDRLNDDGAPYHFERTFFESSDGDGVFLLERCEKQQHRKRWTGGPDPLALRDLLPLPEAEPENHSDDSDSLVA